MTENPGYHDRINPDLLSRIPLQARAVLEVGCGTGALGAAFKARNPGTFYVGVEQQSGPAERAIERLDLVIRSDAEDPELRLPRLPPIDCLIYGDVIEHFQDPWATLPRHLAWLDRDGVLLACIPNVQHWSVLTELLHGRWPVADEGLFDRTHLRWFTRQSIEALVAGCGLHLHELTPRIFRPEEAQAFVRALAPALGAMKIDPNELLAGVAPLQYLLRASRRPRQPLHLDALTLRPQAGMVDVRMTQPLQALSSQPAISIRSSSGPLTLLPATSTLPRLLIWQRPMLSLTDSLESLRQLLRNGYVIVSEYDDDPGHWPAIAENRHLCFTGLHAVQVSTQPLAERIQPFNPELAVFANAIEALPAPRPAESEPELQRRPLRLFFGALNRQADWTPWIGPLNEVLRADPDRWQVEVVHDRAFFEALAIPGRTFTPTCDYPTYRRLMGSCDIAWLPLADTPFNRCKSDLKALEAAAHGLAILASPTVYAATFKAGLNGQVFTTADQLRQALTSWRADPMAMGELGQRARSWVGDNRMLHHQVAAREAWYRSLWDRREQLTRLLLERVPELQG
ncbi:methyltransferase domain-containing protein [Synechococcus sp. CS-1324]|uniref:methyltransferase domain-containing protein n=1 Tax=Synechococcus sp. CS-1324 TaxID=2847980 RepID=UPI00223BE3DD|nr:methyltransferase domain-containing protein [Synechococcus sp. CS-1324]MCT0231426.1 methyltransferase domain-containing protein [Synechococcus sp. CS-1324]